MVKRAGGALLQDIAIDKASRRPISSQLAGGLRGLILNGTLRAGVRLPASRTLAGEFQIARSTVVDAFEQLISEGLVETRVGAGSYVSDMVDVEPGTQESASKRGSNRGKPERLARLMASAAGQFALRIPHEPRAFTTAMPAYDAFPMAQWARIVARHWRQDRAAVLGYNDPRGHYPLREAIAHHLRTSRGISCEWSQVFVFAGAQQAFQLIAGTLIDPGDRVWFENPGAIGARNSFVVQGASIVPVPVDEQGLRVEAGLQRAPDFRLVFVTPSHQQPLGSKMSYERRLALFQAVSTADAWIVEDDWDGEFCFAGRPQPTLKSIDRNDRVIYVGTFSKSMFPSLRLGFMLAPNSLVHTFEMALSAFLPGVPTSMQAAVAEFMNEGHFAAHIRRMRKLYAERHDALIEAGTQQLSPWLELQTTNIGLHTVGILKGHLNAAAISAESDRHGLTVAPISRFCVEPHPREGLVLGFSGITPAKIKAGVSVLAGVLKALAPASRASGMPVSPEWP